MMNNHNNIFLGASIFLIYLDGIFPQVGRLKMTMVAAYEKTLNETAVIIKTYEQDTKALKEVEARIKIVYGQIGRIKRCVFYKDPENFMNEYLEPDENYKLN